jgi:chromosomal replication initiation ATPase DnaA
MEALTQKRLLIEQVCDAVCTEYGIDIDRVFGKDRHKKVSDARVLIIYILHKDLKLSTPFLAQEFNRSASWVLKKCATKKQHIAMYDDCYDEHKRFLELIEKSLHL